MRSESEGKGDELIENQLTAPNSVISKLCVSPYVHYLDIGDAASLLDIRPRRGMFFACALSTLVSIDIHLPRSIRFTALRYASWIEKNTQSKPAIPLLP